MAATIKRDIAVGVTDEILDALENAVAFSGIKSSQYARIALVEKLCREGFMQHPGINRRQQKSVAAELNNNSAAA